MKDNIRFRIYLQELKNNAEDIKLSTLERVAKALGKQLQVNIE
jgi:hypothetical protein